MGESSFDLHLTSQAIEEEDNEVYEYHHRCQFRPDIIEAMRRGNLPFSLRKLIEEHGDLKTEKEEQRRIIAE